MKINYQTKGKVTFSMQDYIDKLLKDTSYDMQGNAKTPAAIHLFNINDGANKLLEENSQLFHHIVAQLLYLCRHNYSTYVGDQDMIYKLPWHFYVQG